MVKTATSGILASLRKGNRAAFRSREIAALLGNSSYAKVVLYRLKERGEVKLVKRGWWAFPDAFPQQVACEVSWPCYLSFFSALAVHGLTTQIPSAIQIAVNRNGKSYELNGEKVKEYKIKSSFTSFKNVDGLPIADPEKAFADCLDIPRSCPLSVMIEVLPNVDVEKIKLLCSKRGLKRLKEVKECA